MRKIFKYSTRMGAIPYIGKDLHVEMPLNARILKVRVLQDTDLLLIWAMVDPDETNSEQRVIMIVPTGAPVPEFPGENWKALYIDTIFDIPFVWHIFQKVSDNVFVIPIEY